MSFEDAMDYRDMRLSNCYQYILQFNDLVERMTRLSHTHSLLFFSPPLNLAKKMRDLCVRAYELQLRDDPEHFEEVRRIAKELRTIQSLQFKSMVEVAERFLFNLDGFTLDALLLIFKYWKVLEVTPLRAIPIVAPYTHRAQDHFIDQFATSGADLLIRTGYYYFDDESDNEVDCIRWSYLPPFIRYDREYHHFCTMQSIASSTAGTEDSFFRIEEADFEEFDVQWGRMVEDGTAHLTEEDFSPEWRRMLARYRRAQEREQNGDNESDSENSEQESSDESDDSDSDVPDHLQRRGYFSDHSEDWVTVEDEENEEDDDW
uniref:BACK domain-containing protein n=2 Tax=Caenorhabditis tropicalis TaxID=1561998 RepID=A0A1I7URZ4_9PELO